MAIRAKAGIQSKGKIMTLWWLQPGWKSAGCMYCGCNIWGAGGDPDMGACPECWDSNHQQEQYEEPEPQEPTLLEQYGMSYFQHVLERCTFIGL